MAADRNNNHSRLLLVSFEKLKVVRETESPKTLKEKEPKEKKALTAAHMQDIFKSVILIT